jgi:hypothetical protein
VISQCALVQVPITVTDIAGHWANYKDPDKQKWVIRVLWMVPGMLACAARALECCVRLLTFSLRA